MSTNFAKSAPGGSLLFFITVGGDAKYRDTNYPIFGIGGCALLSDNYAKDLEIPWQALRSAHFRNVDDAGIRMSGLRPSPAQAEATNHFYGTGAFARFAIVTNPRTTTQNGLGPASLVAALRFKPVIDLAVHFRFSAIRLVIDESEQINGPVTWGLSTMQFKNSLGQNVPISWQFCSKTSLEPGLDVADHVMRVGGMQVYRNLTGIGGSGSDFRAVFQSRFPTSYMDLMEHRRPSGT